MKDFIALVSIENIKLWKRFTTKIILLVMILIIILVTGLYRFNSESNKVSEDLNISTNWKQILQDEFSHADVTLKAYEKSGNKGLQRSIGNMKKIMAEDSYRIINNIKPEESVWSNVNRFNYAALIALFLIITCATVVAGEFSEGTMKMMISRPYKRYEILTAKLIVILSYGILLLGVTFLTSFILNGILFGFKGIDAKDILWTGSKICYVPAVLKTLIIFLLEFFEIFAYVIVTFALSTIVRSRNIATGVSLFLLLAGEYFMQLLAMDFNACKYLPFTLTSFVTFINNGVYINDTTLTFALTISTIYTIVFCFAGYYFFEKRDI